MASKWNPRLRCSGYQNIWAIPIIFCMFIWYGKQCRKHAPRMSSLRLNGRNHVFSLSYSFVDENASKIEEKTLFTIHNVAPSFSIISCLLSYEHKNRYLFTARVFFFARFTTTTIITRSKLHAISSIFLLSLSLFAFHLLYFYFSITMTRKW